MKEMFYLTTHSTHFIYGYMAREETRCHMGYSFRLTARDPYIYMLHPTDKIVYTTAFVKTSCGALVGTRNSSMGPP